MQKKNWEVQKIEPSPPMTAEKEFDGGWEIFEYVSEADPSTMNACPDLAEAGEFIAATNVEVFTYPQWHYLNDEYGYIYDSALLRGFGMLPCDYDKIAFLAGASWMVKEKEL